MERQLFVVTLEAPTAVGERFPRVEAERMAGVIRHAVRDNSCGLAGPVPFKIAVERVDEAAAASAETREYTPRGVRRASNSSANWCSVGASRQGGLRRSDRSS
ncbi:MAG: hypothetical protein V1737_04790 [Chloroflexota bacterium]